MHTTHRVERTGPFTGPGHWSQRVGPFVWLPQLIRQFDVDPAAVFRSAGVAPSAFDDREQRIDWHSLLTFVDHAARATACPHLGLLLGRMTRLTDLGLVGELMLNSPTVGRALHALTLHQHLNSEGGVVMLLERGGSTYLGYALYRPAIAGSSHIYGAALAFAHKLMTQLCGDGWHPDEVLLPHYKPDNVRPYKAVLGVPPRFDAELAALRFPSTDLARPVPGAQVEQLREAERRVGAVGRPDLVEQVRRALRILMVQERYSGDDVARELAMHRRTLNRRLKRQGTTFQHVLDEVRYHVSSDLLVNSDINLDDVAAALGYSAVTPFIRSFRRWSGTSPGHWRRDARAVHRPAASAAAIATDRAESALAAQQNEAFPAPSVAVENC